MTTGIFPPDRPLSDAARTAILSLVQAEPVSDASGTRARRERQWWPGGRLVRTGLVAGAAVAVAAATTLAVIVTSGTPAMAWSATPSPVPSAQTMKLGDACASKIANAHLPLSLHSPQPLLSEARGSSRAVLLGDDAKHVGICISQSGNIRGWRLSGIYVLGPPSGTLTIDAVPGVTGGSDAARAAFGRVSSDAASVVVDTFDGRRVIASVGSGMFLAWWPSGADVAQVTALTASGATLATASYSPEPATITPSHSPVG